jgi:hypothetical protein
MLTIGVNPIALRLLYYSYVNHVGCVKWTGTTSTSFTIQNGVRQGGVLSPYLFAFYINDLLSTLAKTSAGCYFGPNFVGAIIYADDIVLLSPSIKGLRTLLNTTYAYASSHKLKFNPTKSFCVKFNKFNNYNVALPNNHIELGGAQVQWVRKVTHLGNILSHNLDDNPHLSHLIADFYVRVNGLLANIGFVRNPSLLHDIFRSLCCCFYGSVLCSFKCRQFGGLCIAWQKAIRRIYRLPRATHTRFLPLLADTPHISCILQHRFLAFAVSCMRSKNLLVRSVAVHALYDCRYHMGGNFTDIACKCPMLSRYMLRVCSKGYLVSVRTELARLYVGDVPLWRIGFIKDLMCYIDSSGEDSNILRELCEYLCCY